MKLRLPKPSKLTEAEKEALIMEAVSNLPKTSLFPEKVAWAKNLLKNAKFPPASRSNFLQKP